MRSRLAVIVFGVLSTTAFAATATASPVAVTGGVQAVTQNAATVTGAVNPRGAATRIFVRYGPTRAYGSRTADVAVGAGTTRIPVSIPLTGLAPRTRYHYRVVAVGAGTAQGVNRTFKTAGGPIPPVPPPAPTVPEPSKLQLARATIFPKAGVIDILAPITRRASGHVSLELHAAGQRHRWTAPIDSKNRRIRQSTAIPAAQIKRGTGILTMHYPGNAQTRPQTVRLRAANVPAALSSSRPKIVAGRLQASGTISDAARGKVRVQLEYFSAGATTTLEKWATIANGRWALDAPLTPEQQAAINLRQGVVHSYVLFTGYFKARMRGEMRSFQVLGAP
ncbi:MAG: fibronectin type III domain-containing protein [Patulibacter sp.]|nr:fibronectin type III domain-containing protein [Patulibacter sp.]